MFLDLMEFADTVGFDGLAVNEHHQTAGAMTPSPNLLAASLAKNTKNAAILVIGDSVALYNPPTRVAEEMAYLDCLSEGRLIAGFVYGTAMDSVYSYGVPPAELRARVAEARELILRAWEAEEPFAFNGKYTRLRYVNTWPKPVQKPYPPVWVPGSGSIETWDLVTEKNYCYGHLSSRHALREAGRQWLLGPRGQARGDMNPNRMAFTQICCVANSDAEAEKLYYDAVKYFYRYTNRVSRGFTSAPGYRSPQSMLWELERQQSNPDRDRAYKGEMSFGEYADKDSSWRAALRPCGAHPGDSEGATGGAAHPDAARRQPAGGGGAGEHPPLWHRGHPLPPRGVGRVPRPLDPEGEPGGSPRTRPFPPRCRAATDAFTPE
jgi:alkanesulfonate monooxygenase SsuD/methylene tetrahydromethanopterin reductase-like flavin-dependent oxidoreductase (luciferase family)